MEISANFAFLKQEFPHAAESASYAEQRVYGDPRASCFHARHALERLLKRVYKVEKALKPPKVTNLDGYISDPAFRDTRARGRLAEGRIHPSGGQRGGPRQQVAGTGQGAGCRARAVSRPLLDRPHLPAEGGGKPGREDLRRIPRPERGTGTCTPASVQELEALKAKLDAAAAARKEIESELEAVRERLAAIKTENGGVPETHDWNEDKTRTLIIDLDLERAGWPLDRQQDREYEVTGMPNESGIGYADYVLWGDDGKPLAVVEAKKTTVDPEVGQQQAKLYADCLETMHGQRPVIFYTNGYETFLWDDLAYPPRPVAGFYKKDELASLIIRRAQHAPLDVSQVKDDIVERYYQKRAIDSIGEQFAQTRRKALLVMATGSGKTRTAIALVDLLQRAGWVKRALFLADRVSLVNQAVAAFKAHLPESSPVNLVTEKDTTGRVYVCTYPTMMGLINETNGNEAHFSVGHFDLVIIDEAHRSVYQKYGAIFRYFDSLLVGLTATPSDHIDRNTYALFDLEPGVPTDAYELETAVADGFLVPSRVQQVDLKFPREGIDYDSLSDEEQEQWESLDWGDDVDENGLPDKVNAAAINSWLFNKDTVDKVLQHLMEHGHRVEGGDRLAKTILFARNHQHAQFIEERFNHHYPQHKGHFARVIDHYATYPQSLLDHFSQKDNAAAHCHLGRHARHRHRHSRGREPGLLQAGLLEDQVLADDRTRHATLLRTFRPGRRQAGLPRLRFLLQLRLLPREPAGHGGSWGRAARHPPVPLPGATADPCPGDARPGPGYGARGRPDHGTPWGSGGDEPRELYRADAPGGRGSLPGAHDMGTSSATRTARCYSVKSPGCQARSRQMRSSHGCSISLTALRMQVALAEGHMSAVESHRQRMVEIAMLLEEKTTIPAVKAQLEFLASMQESGFWEGVDLHGLEALRLRLRRLVPLLDKKKQKIVYTDFQDQVIGVRDEEVVHMPKMTGAQYEKKVKAYLKNHLDHLVIHRLRTNQPLTATDLLGLERTLAKIGEDDGQTLLTGLLARSEAPSLAHFVRNMVGMDRAAPQRAFSGFLSDQSLTPPQIRFVEMVIDQLTARGVMEASALYEPPFSNLHAGGPEALFGGKKNVIEGIFDTLKAVQSGLMVKAG